MYSLANPFVKLGLALFLFVGVFLAGMSAEYKYFYAPYKVEVQATAKAQAMKVVELNATIDKNAKDSNEAIIYSTKSIHDWYVAHPNIRVRVTNGSCTMSEASGNTSSPNEASSSGYVSPYSAELSEQIANQLNELQRLLISNGVIVQ